MRALFLCNTPYQILVASCVRKSIFGEYDADIIISDHMADGKNISEHISKKLFDGIYYAETKSFYGYEAQTPRLKKVFDAWSGKQISETISLKQKYDVYLCANADPFSVRLYNYLQKFNNKTIIPCWFEDGVGTYSTDKACFQKVKTVKAKIKKLLNPHMITDNLKALYVFQPECLDFITEIEVVKIPSIDTEDVEFLVELNKMFGYDPSVDSYDKQVIFFEDGFVDWNVSNDLELLKLFLKKYRTDEIMVKIHPRDKQNRFGKEGFCTNKNLAVPWEIIACNADLTNTTLVTMYSQSVITPYVLFGKKTKVVVLAKLDKYFADGGNEFFDYLDKYYYSKHPDIYFVPQTVEELITYLEVNSKLTR